MEYRINTVSTQHRKKRHNMRMIQIFIFITKLKNKKIYLAWIVSSNLQHTIVNARNLYCGMNNIWRSVPYRTNTKLQLY